MVDDDDGVSPAVVEEGTLKTEVTSVAREVPIAIIVITSLAVASFT